MQQHLTTIFRGVFWISLFGVVVSIVDFGFDQPAPLQRGLSGFYLLVLGLGLLTTGLRYYLQRKVIRTRVLVFDGLTICFTLLVLYFHFFSEQRPPASTFLYPNEWIKVAVYFTFFREFSEQEVRYARAVLNPAQLFIASFLAVILLGALLLLLPNATHTGISFIDALFTSTSAVCVTGLIVVDTGSYFTLFGQTIILLLIQIGGLGILTFTSYFSYFFKGGGSYENQLSLSDITHAQQLGQVFSTLKNVLLITFFVEAVAGVLIFATLDPALFDSIYQRLYFAVFHAVSAFCNAGFSTLPNGLYELGFRYNYVLQLVIIAAFVLGGLGFPIVVNLLSYLKYRLRALLPFTGTSYTYRPWLLSLNSRVTLFTTFSLIVVGTIGFFFTEYHNTLVEHRGLGKVVTALFGATTPRTAGFNTVDMTALNFSTLMLIFLLMWIGASPASTGGGIKTSTFAIATLNILSLARGKTRLEVYGREIADTSVRRAFAVISLSLIAIGSGILCLSVFDADKNLLGIGFECFSAYGTVGLSIGLTAGLSDPSKFVLIVLMFVGRVSMLTLVIALFRRARYKNYRFPTEELTIN